jgi:hypothetical protein
MLNTAATTWNWKTNLSNITAPIFTGYAPITGLQAATGLFDNYSGNAFTDFAAQTFTCTGNSESPNVTGALVAGSNGGSTATATLNVVSGAVASVTIVSGGSGYETSPSAVYTGTHTTLPVITWTITGGVITGYTIVNPGSGITGSFTVAIQGPLSIIVGGNFPVSVPCTNNGDFVVTVPSLIIPAIAA